MESPEISEIAECIIFRDNWIVRVKVLKVLSQKSAKLANSG